MNTTQIEFKAAGTGTTQCDKILGALMDRRGEWVAMPDLWRASGAFAVHSRIADLRARGHSIDQRGENVEGVRHSFYRLN